LGERLCPIIEEALPFIIMRTDRRYIVQEKDIEEELCVWHKFAMVDKDMEEQRGQFNQGSHNYNEWGCYTCPGSNKDCQRYEDGK
jgi:hypothetical protein